MTLWFGGDYNPEQWPAAVRDEDVALMRRAGVTVVTVGVFAWSEIEPEEGRFEFAWLDDVLDRLHAAGIGVDLATATANPPPWALRAYPDIQPVTVDGVRLAGGSRQHYSPHSPSYRRLAARLVRELATRYGSHPAVVAWHVNNEYGCHVSRCYGEHSGPAFRVWLQARYGTLAALNQAWGTAFWSQRYADWAEIEPPRQAPADPNPAQQLDFDRFSSDALLDLHRAEAAILRELSPGVPVTTNFMGAFPALDYWRWAADVDVVSDDCYVDPADPDAPVRAALSRDLMRSLGGGRPWILMEQATSAVNWRAHNLPGRPGWTRALSLQAVARGADGIMYFQWRQSTSGAEKFHSAMLPQAGTETRVFREVCALGAELGSLASIEGARVDASVAIVFDWDSWWTLAQPNNPASIDYLQLVTDWYRAFWDRSVTVDLVRTGADLSGYDLVVVPALQTAPTAALDSLHRYAEGGGTLVVTFQSGILDETARVQAEGWLGPLRRTLGVWIEEFAPLPDDRVTVRGHAAVQWGEFLHVTDAEVVGTFEGGDLTGWPAITRCSPGAGTAWYVGTHLDRAGLGELVGEVLAGAGIAGVLTRTADGVEAVVRGGRTFVINHADGPREVRLGADDVTVGPRDVRVVQ